MSFRNKNNIINIEGFSNNTSKITRSELSKMAIKSIFGISKKHQNELKELFEIREYEKSKTEFNVPPFQTFKKIDHSLHERDELSNSDLRDMKKLKNVFDSFVDSDENESELKKQSFYLLISLHSKKKLFIDVITSLALVYSLIFTIFNLGFQDINYYPEIVLEIIFIVEILTKFFTQTYDHNDNPITSIPKIIENYMNNDFISDMLISFPYLTLSRLFYSDINNNLLLKFKWIIAYRITILHEKIEFLELQNIFYSNYIKIFRLFSTFFILVHLSSCFWIYLGQKNENSWINYARIENMNKFDIYITSVYFQLVTIYTIGYGDILCYSISERIYNILLLCLGVMLYSFGVTTLSQLFVDLSSRKLAHLQKIQTFENIEKDFQVKNKLSIAIKSSLKAEFEKDIKSRFELLDNLPKNIKRQLSKGLTKKIRQSINFFKNQPSHFVFNVMSYLKKSKFQKNQILYELGERVDEMYIVTSGTLSLNLGKEFNYLEIGTISEDQHFGDVLIETNSISPYQVKCKSRYSEVFVLRKADYIKIKQDYKYNILKTLEYSCVMMDEINKKKLQIHEISTYEPDLNKIKKIYIGISNFIMNRNFHKFYYGLGKLSDLSAFFKKEPREKVRMLIDTIIMNNLNSCLLQLNNIFDKRANILNQQGISPIDQDIKQSEYFLNNKFLKSLKNKTFNDQAKRMSAENKSPLQRQSKSIVNDTLHPQVFTKKKNVDDEENKNLLRLTKLAHNNLFKKIFHKKAIEIYEKCLENNGDSNYLYVDLEKAINLKINQSLNKKEYKSIFSVYNAMKENQNIEMRKTKMMMTKKVAKNLNNFFFSNLRISHEISFQILSSFKSQNSKEINNHLSLSCNLDNRKLKQIMINNGAHNNFTNSNVNINFFLEETIINLKENTDEIRHFDHENSKLEKILEKLNRLKR